jgi:hypothetical protein
MDSTEPVDCVSTSCVPKTSYGTSTAKFFSHHNPLTAGLRHHSLEAYTKMYRGHSHITVLFPKLTPRSIVQAVVTGAKVVEAVATKTDAVVKAAEAVVVATMTGEVVVVAATVAVCSAFDSSTRLHLHVQMEMCSLQVAVLCAVCKAPAQCHMLCYLVDLCAHSFHKHQP